MKQKTILYSLSMLFTMLFIFQDMASAQRVRRTRVVKRTHVTVHVRHPRVQRRAHIKYAALPRWGSVTVAAPAGAVIIRQGPSAFRYHAGIYYAQRSAGFTVVRPARGLRIRVLPVGYRRLQIAKRTYYYYYGTYYVKAGNDAYEVVDAPAGAVVDALPEGYEIKTIADKEYYVLDDVYYAEVDAPEMEDGMGYEVVSPAP